jgi:hypothetical protein
MPREWSKADDAIERMAEGLIANYHPELSTARIMYVFISEAPSKGGHKLYGKVSKASGFLEWALEQDFIVMISGDIWNTSESHERTAILDHLLERCTGEEDEKDASMSWKIREPDVQEFSSILDRHGAWNTTLAGFISVAKKVDLSGFEENSEKGVDLTTVETTEG